MNARDLRNCGHGSFASMRACLSADIDRYLSKSPHNRLAGNGLRAVMSALLMPDLLCVVLHRMSHLLYVRGWERAACFAVRLNYLIWKTSINAASCIGPGLRLPHPTGLVFCGRAGEGLTLYSMSVCCPPDGCADSRVDAGPRLGDRVSIGAHAVVLGPVTVQSDSKVGHMLRLDRDLPGRRVAVRGALPRMRRDAATAASRYEYVSPASEHNSAHV